MEPPEQRTGGLLLKISFTQEEIQFAPIFISLNFLHSPTLKDHKENDRQ